MKRINKAVVISFTSAVVSFVGLGMVAAPAFADSIQNNNQSTSPTSSATATNSPGMSSMTSQTANAWANNQVTQTNNQNLNLDAVTTTGGMIQNNHPTLNSGATASATNNGNFINSQDVGSQSAGASANANSAQSNSQTTSLTNVKLMNTPPSTTSQTMSNYAQSYAQNYSGNGTFTSQTALQTANAGASQANTQTLTGDMHATIDGTMQHSGQTVNQVVGGTAKNDANNGNVGVQSATSFTQGNSAQTSNQNLYVTNGSSVEGEGTIQNSTQNINNNPQSLALNNGNSAFNLGGQSANANNFSGLSQSNSQTGTFTSTKIEPNDLGVNNVQNNNQAFFPGANPSKPTTTSTATNNGNSGDISGTQTANTYNGFYNNNGVLTMSPTSTQSNTQTFTMNQGTFMFNDLP